MKELASSIQGYSTSKPDIWEKRRFLLLSENAYMKRSIELFLDKNPEFKNQKTTHLKNNKPAKHLTFTGQLSYEISKTMENSTFYPDIEGIAKMINTKPIVVYFLISTYLREQKGEETLKEVTSTILPPRNMEVIYKDRSKTLAAGVYLKLDEFTSREEILHAFDVSKRLNVDIFGLKNKGRKRKDYGGMNFEAKQETYRKLNVYLLDFIDSDKEIPAVKSAIKLFAQDEGLSETAIEKTYNKLQEDFDLPGYRTFKKIEKLLNS